MKKLILVFILMTFVLQSCHYPIYDEDGNEIKIEEDTKDNSKIDK